MFILVYKIIYQIFLFTLNIISLTGSHGENLEQIPALDVEKLNFTKKEITTDNFRCFGSFILRHSVGNLQKPN